MILRKFCLSKFFVYVFFLVNFACFFMIYYYSSILIGLHKLMIHEEFAMKPDHLMSSSKCIIRNFDPWAKEVKRFFSKQSYVHCSKYDLLTYVTKNDTNAILHINHAVEKLYSNVSIKCCYMNVTRNARARVPDENIVFSDCTEFEKQHDITNSVVTVICYSSYSTSSANLFINKTVVKQFGSGSISCCYIEIGEKMTAKMISYVTNSKCTSFRDYLNITDRQILIKCQGKNEIYRNTHAPITITEKVRSRMHAKNFTEPENKPFSVLLIGIDSISRLNLIRTMPKTYSFLNKSGWIEYRGFNKIGENTFPNLMAILTGKTLENVNQSCNPTIPGKIDTCNFIWKDYQNLGYVTAFAEDESNINTFNYNKKGFISEPTDYYFRSYTHAVSRLTKKVLDSMDYCTGPEISGERIFNLIKDFSNTYKNYPYFGLFWMNSFSHNKVNSPNRMDAKVLEFLDDRLKAGVFENTIVLFLSDHGMRFGDIRQTFQGWLEERLPFLYFWIPVRFRKKYSKEYENLKINAKNMLTNPYDLHMTLQDILILSKLNYTITPSEGCPVCKSLFQEIMPRSCAEVGINKHWCTCYGYKSISKNDTSIIKAANFVVSQVNERISTFVKESKKCATYKLSKVIMANIASGTTDFNNTVFLIKLVTVPTASFEATVSITNGIFDQKDSYISRLDFYGLHSYCVRNVSLKYVCYCK